MIAIIMVSSMVTRAQYWICNGLVILEPFLQLRPMLYSRAGMWRQEQGFDDTWDMRRS